MSMTTLGHIADVCMGVTLRGRDATRPDPNGSCRMIRISNLSDDGHVTREDILQFEPGENIKLDLFLRPGDVLFPNRGTRTTAYVFDLPDTNVIVGAQFYLIRPHRNVVLPEYVAWFLRSAVAAQHFQSLRKGTLVQTVQRRDIENVVLPLPSLARQDSITALDALAIQERQLSSELALKRASYIQRLMLHAASS